MNLCGWSAPTSGLPAQQRGDDHQIVRQHGGTHEHFEMLETLDQGALHATPTKQHGDAAFDADTESLPSLERPALFEGFPFGASRAAGLRDAGKGDASRLAGLQVLFVKEAAVRTIQIRRGIKA